MIVLALQAHQGSRAQVLDIQPQLEQRKFSLRISFISSDHAYHINTFGIGLTMSSGPMERSVTFLMELVIQDINFKKQDRRCY